MTTLLLPGLGGSGPGHWQSLWRESSPEAELVGQDDWNAPDLDGWIERVATAVDRAPGALIVAHSLACALVAHLVERRSDLLIGGALLVAPADVDDRTRTPASVASFAPIPLERLPFPSIVVGSSNDPTVSIGRAMLFAYALGLALCASARQRAHQRRERLRALAGWAAPGEATAYGARTAAGAPHRRRRTLPRVTAGARALVRTA